MPFPEYVDYDGVGLADLIARRDMTALEVVDAAIARAEELNPRLNAIIYRNFERAREHARGASPDTPFKGVPFLLKDILAQTTEAPTRSASAFTPNVPAPHDAELTARFRRAGLISLGKTNAPEFGLLPITESKLYGAARNPWKLSHSTGGSSGGSAAAVAARIVPLAHANDGGGSIRIPASCCGLVGLKPTRGRNPLGPDLGDVLGGLVVEHVVSRSVRDTAVALDAVAGPDLGDPYVAPPPARPFTDALRRDGPRLKIAFTRRNLAGEPVHADCIAAVESAAALCQEVGHEVGEDAPPVDAAATFQAFLAIWAAGVAMVIDAVAMLTGQKPSEDRFEGLTWGFYRQGKTIAASQYMMAWLQLQRMARAVAHWQVKWDVWLTPTLGAPPLPLGSVDTAETDLAKALAPLLGYAPITPLQNATGQPAINLPLYWNAAGLPIGTQFVGRFGEEATLLALAAELERARPWDRRRPPV
ncbi:MAG TPA: amidase family protein [Stellaceae bacterium]|nr:amidase family protein [Stellaceae bacterium]